MSSALHDATARTEICIYVQAFARLCAGPELSNAATAHDDVFQVVAIER